MTRVFISYSHDSEAHVNQVNQLAYKLNDWGDLVIRLDLYESNPPQGWTGWMVEEIKEADFVLIVCSQGYIDKLEGKTEPSHGKGVKWEGRIIRNLLYEAGSQSAKFVPVFLEHSTESHLPLVLKDSTRYLGHTLEGQENLYRYLTGQKNTCLQRPKKGGPPSLSFPAIIPR